MYNFFKLVFVTLNNKYNYIPLMFYNLFLIAFLTDPLNPIFKQKQTNTEPFNIQKKTETCVLLARIC